MKKIVTKIKRATFVPALIIAVVSSFITGWFFVNIATMHFAISLAVLTVSGAIVVANITHDEIEGLLEKRNNSKSV